MDEKEREELTERSNHLRIELKKWEKEFSAANDGKKASREDIKKNREIATKYKEYNRSRDILSGKVLPEPPVPQSKTPRKRRNEEEDPFRSSKRHQTVRTPSKTPSKTPTGRQLKPWELDPYDSPSVVRSLFTPRKTALGPTPQKDGMVLGLFDLLESDGTITTPSKMEKFMTKTTQASEEVTPRKARFDEENIKQSRTPGSRSKQVMLDGFSTPLKNRDANNQGSKTPSSVSKLHFSTPSFLRRDSQRIRLPPVNENDGELSPQPVRLPRKPLVRGLSSILASLRKLEDDEADDDLDALREMEQEAEGDPQPSKQKPKSKTKTQVQPSLKSIKEIQEPEILVEDSQPQGLLGGFDDEAKFDSDDSENAPTHPLGPDGIPRKAYKKKGQKRTTRLTKMKPTRTAPAPKSKRNSESPTPSSPSHNFDNASSPVPETQHSPPPETMESFEDARNFDSDSQSEYTASEGGTRYRRPNQEKKKNRSMNKDGRIKTAARKVGALAHTNFKRLKLRNTGAKGGPGVGSRFRRKK